MSEEQSKKVLEGVKKSGYPLELYISSLLSKEYSIFPNDYYFDYDGKKQRFVDIFVPSLEDSTNDNLSLNMVIECKKSENASWVFFETQTIPNLALSGQITDYEHIFHWNFKSPNRLWMPDLDMTLHYGGINSPVKMAHTYIVQKKDGSQKTNDEKQKDTIFESVNQVVKYICYKQEKIALKIKESYKYQIFPFFLIFYPIIIFDGDLYNVFLEKDELSIEKRNHIILKHQYQPKYVDGSKPFFIDIIKKDYFEKYLQEMKKEWSDIGKLISDNNSYFEGFVKLLKKMDRKELGDN